MVGTKKSVYIESTIPSYATARDSNNMLNVIRRAQTRDFWENHRHKYTLCVSQDVIVECSDGDPAAVRRRLDFLAGIETLKEPAGLMGLAAVYQDLLAIPDRARVDCVHLAYCVLHRIDFLLSWNCAHLGIPSYLKAEAYNNKSELWTPVLVTPETIRQYYKQEEQDDQ
jgi:hypothetical protein